MFSGKTTQLLKEIERCELKDKKVILFKPKLDTRYNNEKVVTHDGYFKSAITVYNSNEIMNFLLESDDAYDTIAIDEAFMIDDITDCLQFLYQHGKNIMISTLDLSSDCVPFENIVKLFSYATDIFKLKSVCTICGIDACYSYKKIDDGDIISIGGSDKYEPRCFKHHPIMNVLEYNNV